LRVRHGRSRTRVRQIIYGQMMRAGTSDCLSPSYSCMHSQPHELQKSPCLRRWKREPVRCTRSVCRLTHASIFWSPRVMRIARLSGLPPSGRRSHWGLNHPRLHNLSIHERQKRTRRYVFSRVRRQDHAAKALQRPVGGYYARRESFVPVPFCPLETSMFAGPLSGLPCLTLNRAARRASGTPTGPAA